MDTISRSSVSVNTHLGSTPESTHEKLVIAGEIGRVADFVFPSEIGVAEDAVLFSRFQL